MAWTPVQHKESSDSAAIFTPNTTTGNQIVLISTSERCYIQHRYTPGSGKHSLPLPLAIMDLDFSWTFGNAQMLLVEPLQPVTITWSGTPSFPNWVAHEFGSVATSRFCRKIPRFHDFAEKPVVDCEALSPKNSQKN